MLRVDPFKSRGFQWPQTAGPRRTESEASRLARALKPKVLDLPHAACAGLSELMFDEDTAFAAKMVCESCPHLIECRKFAIDNFERFGVWGGMTYRERERERQQRKKSK